MIFSAIIGQVSRSQASAVLQGMWRERETIAVAVHSFPSILGFTCVFLSQAGWYYRWLNYSTVAAPTDPQKKQDRWSNAYDHVFTQHKESLCSQPVLQDLDITKTFTLMLWGWACKLICPMSMNGWSIIQSCTSVTNSWLITKAILLLIKNV